MTIEEAIKKIKGGHSIMMQAGMSIERCNEYKEAATIAIEAMEKETRYKWHDLRENPKDLPTEKGRKYIITQCGNGKYHVAEWDGNYFGEWGTMFSSDGCVFNEFACVDKWKEIQEGV